MEPVSPAGEAGATVVGDLSLDEAERVPKAVVDPAAHLMSDEWKAFVTIGAALHAHDTVRRSQREYVRGAVHTDLYFNEIGFRWSQRTVTGQAERRTR